MRAVGNLEEQVLEQRRQDGVEAARADVLDLVVDAGGRLGDFAHGAVGERDGDALAGEQRGVLLQECVLGLRQDLHEVSLRERV